MFFNILRPRIVVAVLLTIGICIYNTSALVIPDGEYDQLQSRLQTQLLNDNDHNDDNIEDVLNDFKLTGFLSGQIHKALGSYCLSYSMDIDVKYNQLNSIETNNDPEELLVYVSRTLTINKYDHDHDINHEKFKNMHMNTSVNRVGRIEVDSEYSFDLDLTRKIPYTDPSMFIELKPKLITSNTKIISSVDDLNIEESDINSKDLLLLSKFSSTLNDDDELKNENDNIISLKIGIDPIKTKYISRHGTITVNLKTINNDIENDIENEQLINLGIQFPLAIYEGSFPLSVAKTINNKNIYNCKTNLKDFINTQLNINCHNYYHQLQKLRNSTSSSILILNENLRDSNGSHFFLFEFLTNEIGLPSSVATILLSFGPFIVILLTFGIVVIIFSVFVFDYLRYYKLMINRKKAIKERRESIDKGHDYVYEYDDVYKSV